MALTGNIGEWSEVYTFFKLLAEGKLFPADGKMNRIKTQPYPIKQVFRDDSPNRVEYTIDSIKKHVLIRGQLKSLIVSQAEFAAAAKLFLQNYHTIKLNDGAFPEIEEWMHKVLVDKIASKSSDKADIRLVIHNFKTGVEAELGYSIKSRLGGKSTLLNANKDNSNFRYKVLGLPSNTLLTYQAKQLKKGSWLIDRLNYVSKKGGSFEVAGICGDALYANLLMLDMGMPRLISEMLLETYRTGVKSISEITDTIKAKDPLKIGSIRNTQPIYEYKVKQFLLAFALGMTVSKPWNGAFNANGGYIVVKEDGDVVCYHFFDRQQLEDYLYYNTAFDTPSTSRHEFGSFYQEGKDTYIKLNIQIRFLL